MSQTERGLTSEFGMGSGGSHALWPVTIHTTLGLFFKHFGGVYILLADSLIQIGRCIGYQVLAEAGIGMGKLILSFCIRLCWRGCGLVAMTLGSRIS